jgi:Ca2+-binding EF-hand superfamily protein
MFRFLYAIRYKLHEIPGYNMLEAFKLLDFNNSGKICQYKIFTFLRDNDYIASNEEIVAIIRRIDLDGDE